MSAISHVARSTKGCWTCKRRKIGCDKALPGCSNCLRTKRHCEGYGLKLAWPDEDDDGRRPESITCYSSNTAHFFLPASRGQSLYFLNTSSDDLSNNTRRSLPSSAIARLHAPQAILEFAMDPSMGLKFGYETILNHHESSLLSYYSEVLSRMITTIDDSKNGFRTIILPVALSETDKASAGLRQAVFALAAYHLWGSEAALKYKLSAIRLLKRSLQSDEGHPVQQFTAMMMLCVCDVFAADSSWRLHLAGARSISHRLPQDSSIGFLQTWLEYHDVLAGFSSGGRHLSGPLIFAEAFSPPSKAFEDSIIVGALGCSRELLNFIALITRLQSLPSPSADLTTVVRTRLENLIQVPYLTPDHLSGPLSTARILQTAELYRLAALLYLHTTLIPLPRSSPVLQSLVQQALVLMEGIGICTSPWPLFVAAIEIESDEGRFRVLKILETMQRVRRIGNVDVLQQVVEAVWKRMDLSRDREPDERVEWRDLFDMSEHMPSFI